MSANFHTPLSGGADVNIITVNDPLGQLDSAISAQQQQINVGDGTTISRTGTFSDTLVITKSRHVITGGAGGTVKTIDGGESGDILMLSVSSTLATPLKFDNTNNIRTRSGRDIYLSDPRDWLLFLFDGGNWNELGSAPLTFIETDSSLPLPNPGSLITSRNMIYSRTTETPRLSVTPSMLTRPWFDIRAIAGGLTTVGVPAVTTSGTLSEVSSADGAFTNFATGAVSGNSAGFVTASFNVLHSELWPEAQFIISTGPDISNTRIWIGMFTALPTNVDDLAGATKGWGWRYSTVAGDTDWMYGYDDGSTSSFPFGTSGVAVAANTTYTLRLRGELNGPGVPWAWASINGGSEILMSPFTMGGLKFGLAAQIFTTAAGAKSLMVGRIHCESD